MQMRLLSVFTAFAIVIMFVTLGHSTVSAGQGAGSGLYSQPQAERGQQTYGQQCAPCHGPDLMGSNDAPSLSGPDFVGYWKDQTVADLFDVIATTMPSNNPGTLTPAQAAELVAFILQTNSYPAGDKELEQDPAALKTTLGPPTP